MEERSVKIQSPTNNQVALKIIPGHFATTHSHINFYMDMTTMKTRQSEARAIAKEMKQKYVVSTPVDTIICLDGCEVIGAYLADELVNAGNISYNKHETVYVVTPEFNSDGQMIFRDNLQPEVQGKHCLLLVASATTGKTIRRCIECIQYYGGTIEGISAIFSATKNVDGYEVDSIFREKDLPGYLTYRPQECPYCKKKIKIDAMVNGYGYSKL
jgi:orotate phosphoribosyltransferase